MPKKIVSIGLFTLAYILAAAIFAARTHNVEFLFYCAVVVLLGCAVYLIHRRVTLSSGVLFALSIWGLLHMIGGLVTLPTGWPFAGDKNVFYSLWIIPNFLKYDHVIHAYGFGVTTWMLWEIVRSTFPSARTTLGILTLCVLASMGLGAFNEIVEFVAVLLVPQTNVGGYNNTAWDLVSNMIGAICAAVIIARTER